MFVALEVLSLPLYLLCGLARRRRLLSQEASLKYFLLGAFSSAFFLYGVALLYGYAGTRAALGGIATAVSTNDRLATPCCSTGHRAARGRAAVQDRRRAVPLVDAGRLPGRADAGHRVHGGLHQGRRVRRPAAGVLRRRSAALRWDWQPIMWASRSSPWWSARSSPSPRPTSSGCSRTPRSPTPASSSPAWSRRHSTPDGEVLGVSSVLFYLLAYGFIDDRRVRGRDAGARLRRRGDPPVPVGRAGQPVAAGRRHLHPLPAGLRRHPADQRLHRRSSRCSRAAIAGGAAPLVVVGVAGRARSRRSSTSGSSC